VAASLDTLLRGYRQAHERWKTGPRLSLDAEEAFMGIFEALNWAVVVDDRLRQVSPTGKRWPTSHANGAIVAGFRYARNTVHHDWSDALCVEQGAVLPAVLPMPLFEWCWEQTLPAANARGAAEYAQHLAGKPARFTLEQLDALFTAEAASVT
jgi:hypothetical protein